MTTQLFPFQSDLCDQAMTAWGLGFQNVMLVLPTGSGKTVLFSHIMANNTGPAVAIAHRQELVSQISMALARNGVRHRVVGPSSVAHTCTSLHMAELHRNYVDPFSPNAVCGVDTLTRMSNTDHWLQTVTLWVQDEAHHLLRSNTWGKAVAMFPNARGLGVTATPTRADGQGLGRHADGVIDSMLVGPGMRDLIDQGYLSEYRIFAPPSDLDLTDVPITAGGDFSPVKLSVAVHRSHIIGDVVEHYKRIATGKLGVTFAVDVETAGATAKAYRAAGVAAEVVSANTPVHVRATILRRFAKREILQLVNVDLFGEGFDLPAIEVVSMARPTQSYGLFCQQFGRALRRMDGKTHAIIIDHVGNVHRHGLPDAYRKWTLDRRDKRGKSDTVSVIPTRTCPKCTAAYERTHHACPFCGHVPEYVGRSAPEQVDGDLFELTPEALNRLRGVIEAPVTWHPDKTIMAINKYNHELKQQAQRLLREAMSRWAGRHSQAQDEATIRHLQRRFFLTHGVDVANAQALGRKDADDLRQRIEGS